MVFNKKTEEGFWYGMGLTLAVITTVAAVGFLGTAWRPGSPIQSQFAGRVSPVNPNLDYSTIKGISAATFPIGHTKVGIRTI